MPVISSLASQESFSASATYLVMPFRAMDQTRPFVARMYQKVNLPKAQPPQRMNTIGVFTAAPGHGELTHKCLHTFMRLEVSP